VVYFSKGGVAVRCAIFIDGANLYYMQRNQLGWNVDLQRFSNFIEQFFGRVVEAYYYTAVDPKENSRSGFLQMLPYLGYTLVAKPLKEIVYNGVIRRKGNLDIEIVLDMFNTIENYDCAVLVSGDSDFQRALDLLRARGKTIVVVSHPGTISRELLSLAGRNFIDIQSIEQYVRLQQQGFQNNLDRQQPTTLPEPHTV
jgi:uncharacterized LabA/DUF88 family protein